MDQLSFFQNLDKSSNMLLWACNAEGHVTYLNEKWKVPSKNQDFLEVLSRWICNYELGNTEWLYLDAFHKKMPIDFTFKHTENLMEEQYRLVGYPVMESGEFCGYCGICMPNETEHKLDGREAITYEGTSFFNQTYLERVVKALLRKKEQEDHPFSLIGIQLRAKAGGERLHLNKEELLDFADVFKKTLRRKDIACYIGDNRFVLLVQTSPKEVSGIVHRLCGLLHCEMNESENRKWLIHMGSVHADEVGSMAQMLHLLEKRMK